MKSIILDIKDIDCGYGKKNILKNINISIERGSILGIIGPNGSGKTTLFRAITKALTLTKGNIIFNDINVNQLSYKDMAKKLALATQMHSDTSFNMTVEEMVMMGRIPHLKKYQFAMTKSDMGIIESAMDSLEIAPFRKREISSLSGGEMQRVFIARALTQEPELLLLDEPTSFLDITHQVKILDLIRKLNKNLGLTVVMVMHDLNLASEYCQRLVLLKEGCVHATGRPNEVMDYRIIENVYKTRVVVKRNPASSKPHIFVVSGDVHKRE